MKLYFYGFLMLCQKFILRRSTGKSICWFAEKMGVVYIKMAQILAMQNYGTIFTEDDRIALSQICDHCNPISYNQIEQILRDELGERFAKLQKINPEPLGSASISQVHRAILETGEVVAVKVKRQDVTRRVERDVKQIRRFVHRFGRFAKLRNMLGGDKALDLWAEWIFQETDFEHERQNLQRYQEFATSVNGKIHNTVNIATPKVYPEFCTQNIIVMEYIANPTINQLPLTSANKERISRALNDYVSLSFYALFHNLPVVSHGDPHGGNIYLDQAGNVGFLDMGLIFEFSPDETKLIKQLFLTAYSAQTERLVDLLVEACEHTAYDREVFMTEIKAEAERFQDIPVTQFFVEMINVFTKYNMSPPTILFKAAKAFIALFGINNFIENYTSTKNLLAEQVVEYYVKRTVDDFRGVAHTGAKLVPNCLLANLRHGLVGGSIEQLRYLRNFNQEVIASLENFNEALDLLSAHPLAG